MRRLQLAAAIAIVVFSLVTGRPGLAGELPRAQPDQVGLDAAKLQEAGALFREAVDKKEIAGAVLLVARHGKVAYLEAVGKQDVEAGVAMSPGSIFRIASMTKPITSTAAMILADQGRLDLSDPISKFLPEFKFMKVAMPRKKGAGGTSPGNPGEEYELVQAYRPITVRDLLMHTSGLCYRFTDRPYVGRLYAEAKICDGLIPSDVLAGRERPPARRVAPAPSARDGLGVRPQHRRAGPTRGSRLGTAAGCLLRRADLPAAQDVRHVLPSARCRPQPPGRALRARAGRQDQAGRRRADGQGGARLLGRRGVSAEAGVLLRRGGPAVRRPAITPGSCR